METLIKQSAEIKAEEASSTSAVLDPSFGMQTISEAPAAPAAILIRDREPTGYLCTTTN